MKVFIIPSWYPSLSNPIYGIFNKEQAELLSINRKTWKIGVSTWGQGDERLMLRAMDWKSIGKAIKKFAVEDSEVYDNLKTYFTPAFTWSRKFRKGNIDGIIDANRENLLRFTSDFGTPDVISVHAAYPGAVVAKALSEAYDIPYVVTAHMGPFPFPEFLKNGKIKPLIKSPLDNASALIATSDHLKDTMQSFGLSNIGVVPNPVNTDYFTPKASLHETNPTILSIGRMEDEKGIDLLLKAFSGLSHDRVKLRIGGAGSRLREYQKLTRSLGIDNRVTWLGGLSREEVLDEMRSCSFFALASRYETFGIVLVEAMACGKPIMATRCGGPEEIVTENVGMLCDTDEKDMRNGLAHMIDKWRDFDPRLIREEAVNKFSPPVWANQVEKVFKSVIER